jgi:hypothetical protein
MNAFERIVPALIARARQIAAAQLAERRQTPDRWRKPSLLWPLFAKD